MWGDFDFGDTGHATINVAKDESAAKQLIAAFPLKPSITVHSGGGFHAYWLFREMVDRPDFIPLLNRWKGWWSNPSAEGGSGVDRSVLNVSAMLRVPGTSNLKAGTPRPVTLLHCEPDRRYDLDQLFELLPDVPKAAARAKATSPSRTTDGAAPARKSHTWHVLAEGELDGMNELTVATYEELRDRFGAQKPIRRQSEGQDCIEVVRPLASEGDDKHRRGGYSGIIGLTAPDSILIRTNAWPPFLPNQVYGLETLRQMNPNDEPRTPGEVLRRASGVQVRGNGPPARHLAAGEERSKERLQRLGERVFNIDELTAMPPISWLVRGILPAKGLGFIYGPSGAGKSFVAVDLALSLASGIPFAGRPVTAPVTVLYVLAEGSFGFNGRISAWKAENPTGDPGDRFLTLPEPVNLADYNRVDAEALGSIAVERQARVVIIDTLARAMVGADENSAQDMGVFVANVDQIAKAIDGLVIVIHHSGKDYSKGMRGSSAAFGGADVVIGCTSANNVITLKGAKMKDGAPFPPLQFKMNARCGSLSLQYLTPLNHPPSMNPGLDAFLEIIEEYDRGEGVDNALIVALLEDRTNYKRTKYYSIKKQAEQQELIQNAGKKGSLSFALTPEGEEHLRRRRER